MKRRTVVLGLMVAALSKARARAVEFEMMSPGEAVALEHSTRERRLRRLVREHGLNPVPEFSQYLISSRQLPFNDGVDIPVLRVVFPESTFFDVGSSEVVPSAERIISAMARMLQGDVPDVAVIIAGHTDSTGSEDYNYKLSVHRARSVATELRRAGANAPDIWEVGFGESLPIYDNESYAGKSYNRRVEFLFSAKPEAGASWLKDQMDVACTRAESPRVCRNALNPRREFLMESVARIIEPPPRVVKVPERPQGKTVPPPPQNKTTVAPPNPTQTVVPQKQRQIVINLAERKFVVRKPEL